MKEISELIVIICDELKELEIQKDNGTLPLSSYYRKKKKKKELLDEIIKYQASVK